MEYDVNSSLLDNEGGNFSTLEQFSDRTRVLDQTGSLANRLLQQLLSKRQTTATVIRVGTYPTGYGLKLHDTGLWEVYCLRTGIFRKIEKPWGLLLIVDDLLTLRSLFMEGDGWQHKALNVNRILFLCRYLEEHLTRAMENTK